MSGLRRLSGLCIRSRGTARYEGRAQVSRGAGSLARFIAGLFGFPRAGDDVPVAVEFRIEEGRERWRRIFAGRAFESTQERGRGRFDGLLVERFGALAFGLAVTEDGGRLGLILRRWSAFGIPMPLFLAPRNEALEHDAGGRFNFHVEIGLPMIGRIVKYQGWLMPVTSS